MLLPWNQSGCSWPGLTVVLHEPASRHQRRDIVESLRRTASAGRCVDAELELAILAMESGVGVGVLSQSACRGVGVGVPGVGVGPQLPVILECVDSNVIRIRSARSAVLDEVTQGQPSSGRRPNSAQGNRRTESTRSGNRSWYTSD